MSKERKRDKVPRRDKITGGRTVHRTVNIFSSTSHGKIVQSVIDFRGIDICRFEYLRLSTALVRVSMVSDGCLILLVKSPL